MSDKVPDWVKAEADKVAGNWNHPLHHDHHVLSQDVASALLSAYRRGVEDSVAEANNVAANPPRTWFVRIGEDKVYERGALDSATAIRRLGEAE